MTRQRNDDKSTEFGLWLRKQPEIDSDLGYVTTNIDYLWRNYNRPEWMLIEEKRYGASIPWWQRQCFDILDAVCKSSPHYGGFHFVKFEKTNPEDGRMWWDGSEINKEELIKILSMSSK
jgi:hypothetical protein